MYKNRPELFPTIQSIYDYVGGKIKAHNELAVRLDDNTLDDGFDDYLISFDDKGKNVFIREATTVPGRKYTINPMAGTPGAGRIARGFYEDSHIYGIHMKSRPDIAHYGFLQRGVLKIYRDEDKDGIIDNVDSAAFGDGYGGNIHARLPGMKSDEIGAWSAMCQVARFREDHDAAMQLYRESAQFGKRISLCMSEIEDWIAVCGHTNIRQWIWGI